jgi:hypothetical protein
MSVPHAPSSSMALTLPPPPSSNTFALISKPPMCSNSTTAPPQSPDTPPQTPPPPPASVKKKSQPWPQDLFQFMRQHVEVLVLPSSHSSNSSTSTGGKEKRDCRGRNEQEEAPLEKNQRRRAATTESGSGIEVELRAQSLLPEDWEQFLDLKVRRIRAACARLVQVARSTTNLGRCLWAFFNNLKALLFLFFCDRRVSFSTSTGVHANEPRRIPESLFAKRTNPCELLCWKQLRLQASSHPRRTTTTMMILRRGMRLLLLQLHLH